MSSKRARAERRVQVNGAAVHEPPPRLQNILGLDAGRFHPLSDQVLVEVELESESTGGIILPPQAQQRELGGLPVGRVLGVGADVKRVSVGDMVLASPREAQRIDVLLWLVPESKLLCKVDPKVESSVIRPV